MKDFVIASLVLHVSIVEYWCSMVRISKDFHVFFLNHKKLLKQLIQREWNQIFNAYPQILRTFDSLMTMSQINKFIAALNNDFQFLLNNSNFTNTNVFPTTNLSQTNDEILIHNTESILKCCSLNQYIIWLNKIATIKQIKHIKYLAYNNENNTIVDMPIDYAVWTIKT